MAIVIGDLCLVEALFEGLGVAAAARNGLGVISNEL